jgi:hypothetical protein
VTDPSLDQLEEELRAESKGWTEGYLVRLYRDSRQGLEAQADEEAVLADHGYLTQSSELAREGSLMVAYVLVDQADEYTSLEHTGLGAATDPSSAYGRFATPLVWVIAIAIFLFVAWLLIVNLSGA